MLHNTRWTSRRTFLATACAIARAGAARFRPDAQSRETRLILLGTAGGPSPKKSRAAPSQVILSADSAFVVDCGNGVARQLALAGVPLQAIRHVFLTHHHSDHNADYGTLLLLAWASGLEAPVDAWGPPPLNRITRLFLEMSEPDIEIRRVDEGRTALGPLLRPHELTGSGPVVEDRGLKVSCASVDHPLVPSAFAYRFDGEDRSIVISGDTRRSANLIRLAQGADVLVHEALHPPSVDAIAGTGPHSAALRKHLLESHTPVEEVGRIAAEAGVKTLILSHLVPAESPAVPDEVWLAAARRHFSGRTIVGRDLLEID